MREILKREPPDGDIKSKLSTRVRQIPDWLRYFCSASISTNLLGIEFHPPESVFELKHAKSDRSVWPYLPQGVLEPRGDQIFREEYRFIDVMSLEEQISYLTIRRKPEQEWTRHEHRFIQEMQSRETSTRGLDSMTESKQKEPSADNSDDGAGE
jgi:hypothetical protein